MSTLINLMNTLQNQDGRILGFFMFWLQLAFQYIFMWLLFWLLDNCLEIDSSKNFSLYNTALYWVLTWKKNHI